MLICSAVAILCRTCGPVYARISVSREAKSTIWTETTQGCEKLSPLLSDALLIVSQGVKDSASADTVRIRDSGVNLCGY